jgi:hypothetical protein
VGPRNGLEAVKKCEVPASAGNRMNTSIRRSRSKGSLLEECKYFELFSRKSLMQRRPQKFTRLWEQKFEPLYIYFFFSMAVHPFVGLVAFSVY